MRVEIGLLGGFSVRLDGVAVPADSWRRRPAAALVKLLALAPRRRLHRDRAIDALWPEVAIDAALPRLHKAAHFARQALTSRDGVVLRDELVMLLPSATVEVDVAAFETAATAATSPEECVAAAALYPGDLLPDDLGEPWADEPRDRLRGRYVELLRGAGRWQALLDLDPADEQAHVELLRAAVTAGDRAGALRRYDELERVLAKELGVEPGPEAVALRERARNHRDPVSVPSPARFTETLVERDEELASLSRTARSVFRTGRGCVVVLAGEAGSGKSSLTRAFLDRLDDGITAAVGGCDDLLAPRSLGPFRDLAEARPELAAALTAAGGQPEEVLPALLRFLAARPTVLVLEDVHWADDATLDAIRYLSRRISTVPALMLLTHRDDEVDPTHPLRGVLGGLGSAVVRRIELGSLSVDGVRRLSGMDDAEAAEMHRVTRGNPFFVTEVLAAGGDAVPPTVRDAVLARVGRLPAPVRRLAERLAVVPSRAERWLADALAGDNPDAVAQAERSGVISGGPDAVSFRHELARRAVENSLTVGELVLANREVLDVLLRRPTIEPSRVVHHAARAARADVLIEYGPIAAADAERTGAHRQAAETLRVVLDHDDALDPRLRATLRTRRAYSLYVVNDYEAALSEVELAVAAAEAYGDPVVLADALVVRSRIAFFAHGPFSARRSAHRAVALLEGTDDRPRLAAALIELARTHGNLGTVGIVAQPSTEMLEHAERALALGKALDRDDLRAQALCYLGSGRLALGDSRGQSDIEEGIALGADESRLEIRVRSYVNAAGSTYRYGRFDDARDYIGEGLRLAADGEFAAGEYRLHLTSAAVSASAGAWDEAIAELESLLTSADRAGLMVLLVRGLLARLLARRGSFEAARDVLDPALADPRGTGDSYVAGPLAIAVVELGWLDATSASSSRGEPRRAVPARVSQALDPPDRVSQALDLPDRVSQALDLAVQCGHTAIAGELAVYLKRAGHPVDAAIDAPDPWGAALAGRWRDSAAGWEALGERYEQAVTTALAVRGKAREASLATLRELGASATVARLLEQAG